MNDLKFALRQLFRNPGFTVVAVLTLGLGIGANTGRIRHPDGIGRRPFSAHPAVTHGKRDPVVSRRRIWSVTGLVGVRALAVVSPADLAQFGEFGLDGSVLAFALVLTLGAGVAFGLTPAYQAARTDFNTMLKEVHGGTTAGRWHRKFRSALVIAEVALSLVLLVCAGLLGNSFIRLLSVDTGYQPRRVLTVALSFGHPKYTANSPQNFIERLIKRVSDLPGVQSAAVTSWVPVAGGRDRFAAGFLLEGRRAPGVANMSFVTADYFKVMGIPLLQGRFFTSEELAGKAPAVKIVSESFAKKYFAEGSALGQRFVGGVGGPGKIVGVVKDTLEAGLDAPAEPHIYHASVAPGHAVLVVRTRGEGRGLAEPIGNEILRLDQDQGVPQVQSMTGILRDSIAERRFQTLLMGAFSGFALLLAAIGLYGLMAYTVSLSRREIGVRMALGAQRTDLMKFVLGRGLQLVMAGIFIGTGLAYGATRSLARPFFGVSTDDPATYVVVSVLLAAVGLLACYIPARRATRLDPVTALRLD